MMRVNKSKITSIALAMSGMALTGTAVANDGFFGWSG